MITEQAKERCRVLAFWKRHGTKATKKPLILKTNAFSVAKQFKKGIRQARSLKPKEKDSQEQEKKNLGYSHFRGNQKDTSWSQEFG